MNVPWPAVVDHLSTESDAAYTRCLELHARGLWREGDRYAYAANQLLIIADGILDASAEPVGVLP